MKAPDFWTRPPGLRARALSPLGAVYGFATARRLTRGASTSWDPGVPVICVGNLNAGGTGKTPTVIDVLSRLASRGIAGHVVTRGHGGRLSGPVQVDPARHQASETGDEPLLLAAFAPVWVAGDRAAGARAAVRAGAQAIVLDDGFQDPALVKTLSIVVVDAETGFGNGHCIPAGPLREPVAAGLERADLLLSVGDQTAQDRFSERWGTAIRRVPRVQGRLEPLQTGMDWQGARLLAFAGIGRPEKFFATLRGLGADLAATHALADHQPLTQTLLTRLARDADRLGAQLVTTEKDAVRLPAAARPHVLTLPVRLRLAESAPLDDALARVLADAARATD